jgi:hypothetical protein
LSQIPSSISVESEKSIVSAKTQSGVTGEEEQNVSENQNFMDYSLTRFSGEKMIIAQMVPNSTFVESEKSLVSAETRSGVTGEAKQNVS